MYACFAICQNQSEVIFLRQKIKKEHGNELAVIKVRNLQSTLTHKD